MISVTGEAPPSITIAARTGIIHMIRHPEDKPIHSVYTVCGVFVDLKGSRKPAARLCRTCQKMAEKVR